MRQNNRYQMPPEQYMQHQQRCQQQMQAQQTYQQQLEQQQRQQNQWAMQPQYGHTQIPPQHIQRQISIEDAIGIARNQVPGQVTKAELERKGGQLIYEVDVVTNQGVKYEVKINADTGEVMEVELD